MPKSFAVVVRAFDGEAPYFQSFINHHRSIGVEKFYVVLAPGASPLCRQILAQNKIEPYEVEGQRVGGVWRSIQEDYVAVLDADEYLHPDLIKFASKEDFQTLAMPWRLTATLDDHGFLHDKKKFFVFPQIKSIMRTRNLAGLGLHQSRTRGDGLRLGIKEGLSFPVQHYYLRGLDDLLLKDGGVVPLTRARSMGRKPVSLGGDSKSDVTDFPSRHAKVAFVLKMLDQYPKVKDRYQLQVDTDMLSRLRECCESDPEETKVALRESVESIQNVFTQDSIENQVQKLKKSLSDQPRKVSFQKRVLKILRRDFNERQSK
ncbi:MAG: glycosyl transferase family 2 [Cyanobium sp. NAT70]|nr:glycosyl transferase family 2 [Cyanobium sp. NAT70]